MSILKIRARRIFDSRGNPTLEVDLITDIGLLRCSVPREHISKRNDETGKVKDLNITSNEQSILKAMDNINNIIAPAIIKSKLDVCQQKEIDSLMIKLDGTKNKSKLGANAVLAVSIVCCKAAAAKKGLTLYNYIASMAENQELILPIPLFTIIGGGNSANNKIPFDSYMVMLIGAKNFADAMKMGIEICRDIEEKIAKQQEDKLPLPFNDNGCFTPKLEDNQEVLQLIDDSIKSVGFDGKVKLALDIAASSFHKEGMYDLAFKSEDSDPTVFLNTEAMKDEILQLLTAFPSIISIQDPFDREDWDGWQMISDQSIQVVADDLTSMNIVRIEDAVEEQLANCLLIRLVQIGTITEAIKCSKLAKTAGWSIIVEAGAGETEDSFIADFAVGISSEQIKIGGLRGTERMAKYNQLLRIELELGKNAKYAGSSFKNFDKN